MRARYFSLKEVQENSDARFVPAVILWMFSTLGYLYLKLLFRK